AGQTPEGLSALYELSARLAALGDALVDAVIEASVRREADEGTRGRRQLLDTLLFGRYALSDQVRARALGAGIDPAVRLLVIVGTAEGARRGESPEQAMRLLADGLTSTLR